MDKQESKKEEKPVQRLKLPPYFFHHLLASGGITVIALGVLFFMFPSLLPFAQERHLVSSQRQLSEFMAHVEDLNRKIKDLPKEMPDLSGIQEKVTKLSDELKNLEEKVTHLSEKKEFPPSRNPSLINFDFLTALKSTVMAGRPYKKLLDVISKAKILSDQDLLILSKYSDSGVGDLLSEGISLQELYKIQENKEQVLTIPSWLSSLVVVQKIDPIKEKNLKAFDDVIFLLKGDKYDQASQVAEKIKDLPLTNLGNWIQKIKDITGIILILTHYTEQVLEASLTESKNESSGS